MESGLMIMGIFIIITTYVEAKSDNSILSKESLKIFPNTIIAGYILGSVSIITALVFLFMAFC
ncbi:hypothetical protein [Clostridium beijerinckii]|jgi:hypothetical protein|uniref:Uncharacterized protein n=1 Tax=Clostridium beijerinckii TaxID=1520 RepID=A0AAW3W637_CLOBE|nr:hypothetical protein [Clostridium beijerinckii]MBC2457299.1 hypothetical protein [Clostridium beijerinckii]MBC2474355.1 hypothetical protein [Clostridium beijerinckii]NOV59010.1 hypothetical protein [Clostridium beijerinckii]NOV71602.1 hypothetical protein [Clostridium beijerinckii]NOW32365.1 hypothetical protein [Clostridium beijerinckii]